ncbi:MAG TPA: hypothetical protein VMF03_20495 [Steroidobacteraceae bacterium]|nr:hypothetical protein [Steroidobacteraceae bacterium]
MTLLRLPALFRRSAVAGAEPSVIKNFWPLVFAVVLCTPPAQALDFHHVVVGQKFNAARAGIPFSAPSQSSKTTALGPMQERFGDCVIARTVCHVVVTTTADDDVVQDILIYWTGSSDNVLKAMERKYGKPVSHIERYKIVHGHGLNDAVSSWSEGVDVVMEFHSMDGDGPYLSMSTRRFIAGQ